MRTTWIDRGFELDLPAEAEGNLNYPFAADNFDIPLRHYGLIRLCRSRHRVQLTWDVDCADRDSFDFAIRILSRSTSRRIELRYYKSGWARELFNDSGKAAERVAEISSFAGVTVLPQTSVLNLPISRLTGAHSILQKCFAAWRSSDFLAELHGHGLLAWSVLLSRRGRCDMLRFETIGARSGTRMAFGAAAAKNAIGQHCAWPLGGGAFDDRVAHDYDEALCAGTPLYQHIIGNVSVDGWRCWWPYQRLILPYRDPGGAESLYSITRITRQLDFRLLAGQVPIPAPAA